MRILSELYDPHDLNSIKLRQNMPENDHTHVEKDLPNGPSKIFSDNANYAKEQPVTN